MCDNKEDDSENEITIKDEEYFTRNTMKALTQILNKPRTYKEEIRMIDISMFSKYIYSGCWVNSVVYSFIEDLSFDGYVLAGSSISELINGIPLTSELDMYVENFMNYIKAFGELKTKYTKFELYPSTIKMSFENESENTDKLPFINLIYTKQKWGYNCYYVLYDTI